MWSNHEKGKSPEEPTSQASSEVVSEDTLKKVISRKTQINRRYAKVTLAALYSKDKTYSTMRLDEDMIKAYPEERMKGSDYRKSDVGTDDFETMPYEFPSDNYDWYVNNKAPGKKSKEVLTKRFNEYNQKKRCSR